MAEEANVDSAPRRLQTVAQFCDEFRFITQPGVRGEILNSADRENSRGERIPGNGLAESGAIVRKGRRVLIDPIRYFKWIAEQQQRVTRKKAA